MAHVILVFIMNFFHNCKSILHVLWWFNYGEYTLLIICVVFCFSLFPSSAFFSHYIKHKAGPLGLVRLSDFFQSWPYNALWCLTLARGQLTYIVLNIEDPLHVFSTERLWKCIKFLHEECFVGNALLRKLANSSLQVTKYYTNFLTDINLFV